jgi:hypothetical protein
MKSEWGLSEANSESVSSWRLVPMKIGNATVYIEQVGELVTIESDDSIRAVRPPNPQEVFETAGQILYERTGK